MGFAFLRVAVLFCGGLRTWRMIIRIICSCEDETEVKGREGKGTETGISLLAVLLRGKRIGAEARRST